MIDGYYHPNDMTEEQFAALVEPKPTDEEIAWETLVQFYEMEERP